MASLAIRYLPPASDELEEAVNWYVARNPAAAQVAVAHTSREPGYWRDRLREG